MTKTSHNCFDKVNKREYASEVLHLEMYNCVTVLGNYFIRLYKLFLTDTKFQMNNLHSACVLLLLVLIVFTV